MLPITQQGWDSVQRRTFILCNVVRITAASTFSSVVNLSSMALCRYPCPPQVIIPPTIQVHPRIQCFGRSILRTLGVSILHHVGNGAGQSYFGEIIGIYS